MTSPFDTAQIYYPYLCNITSVTSTDFTTVITTAIDHQYVVGNQVTFQVPQQWGMRQLDRLKGYVLAVSSNTLTVNINTSTFDPFVVPSQPPFVQPAQVLAIGDANTGNTSPQSYPFGIDPVLLIIPGSYAVEDIT